MQQQAGAFWSWWKGELIAFIPARWLSLAVRRGALVSLDGDDVVLHEVRLGKLTEIERVRLTSLDPAGQVLAVKNLLVKRKSTDTGSARLCLAAGQYLRKRFSMPLATEENLREVLGFEMDRYTPFKAGQVYFDYRIVARNPELNMLEVEAVLLPRTDLDPLVARLEAFGVEVGAVLCGEEFSKPVPDFDLLRSASRVRPVVSRLRYLNLALFAVLCITLGVAVIIPIWQKREAAQALIPKVGQAKGAAGAADAVRQELEKLAAESNYILGRKHALPATLDIVEKLSAALPDTTWVQVLEIKSGAKNQEVIITGETASSSRLIETVEQIGVLQNASFRSPLTKGQAPNSERFVLGAEVKPRPLPASIPETELTGSNPGAAPAAVALPSPPPAPQTATNVAVETRPVPSPTVPPPAPPAPPGKSEGPNK